VDVIAGALDGAGLFSLESASMTATNAMTTTAATATPNHMRAEEFDRFGAAAVAGGLEYTIGCGGGGGGEDSGGDDGGGADHGGDDGGSGGAGADGRPDGLE
jgi:hypothetical protein